MAKVIKLRNKSQIYGTSFHNGIVCSSMQELEYKFGVQASIECDCKVNFELGLEVDGTPFTIYDWKEGLITKSTVVWFHIGTITEESTKKVVEILKNDYNLTAKYETYEEILARHGIKLQVLD